MVKHSVLVVDDDENHRWLLKTYMQKHDFQVILAENGSVMREQLEAGNVDIVLLDVSMPGEDGFKLARYLREHHSVGIIMLTASGELIDRVLGLEIGADDYVTKPFEPRELMARVKAVLRRLTDQNHSLNALSNPEANNHCLRLGKFHINLNKRELTDNNGDVVVLTSMEFNLVVAFAKNPDIVLSRDRLLDLTHKGANNPFDRSIDIRIGRVRKKLEDDPSDPRLIQTARGVGYIYSQQN